MAFPLRFRRFLTRAALRTHETQVRAFLVGLTDAELTEMALLVDDLGEIIARTAETRRGLREAAR